ncbi:MAG: phosphoribosylaminoimidazolesuccinocarboxamide synthase [Calditrichia bacterium]
MEAKELILESKTKKLYSTNNEDQIVIEFLDTIPGLKQKSTMKGKAEINLDISAFIFEYLESYNVPTHFIRRIDSKSFLAKKLNMFPLKVVLWNVATSTLSKRLGLKDGTVLDTPVLELYLKNSKLKDPLINDYHAYTLGLCERNEMNAIVRISTKVNAVLKSLFMRKKLALVYFELEFGKTGSQIMIGDEISPDTFHIWDQAEPDKLDKKSFLITPETAKKVYPKIKERILQ